MNYPIEFLNLIDAFRRLPGIGAKSAERMAFDVLSMNNEALDQFSAALNDIKNISRCPVCGNLSSKNNLCDICSDDSRDHKLICVVCSPKDVFAFEKMKEYRGLYHVLNGKINPSKGIGSENINLQSLLDRIDKEKEIKEVILATDLTMEGEITAMYITKLLNAKGDLEVTRLAHGLPMGAQLDYADEMTLFKAFSNREKV